MVVCILINIEGGKKVQGTGMFKMTGDRVVPVYRKKMRCM
jgi:hypothetical protein